MTASPWEDANEARPGGAVYCEPSLDIPSEIIKRYDASKELIRKYHLLQHQEVLISMDRQTEISFLFANKHHVNLRLFLPY